MQPSEVTNNPAEWEQIRKDLWKNKIWLNVYSTDAGATFTISTERIDPEIPREVFISRVVKGA